MTHLGSEVDRQALGPVCSYCFSQWWHRETAHKWRPPHPCLLNAAKAPCHWAGTKKSLTLAVDCLTCDYSSPSCRHRSVHSRDKGGVPALIFFTERKDMAEVLGSRGTDPNHCSLETLSAPKSLAQCHNFSKYTKSHLTCLPARLGCGEHQFSMMILPCESSIQTILPSSHPSANTLLSPLLPMIYNWHFFLETILQSDYAIMFKNVGRDPALIPHANPGCCWLAMKEM